MPMIFLHFTRSSISLTDCAVSILYISFNPRTRVNQCLSRLDSSYYSIWFCHIPIVKRWMSCYVLYNRLIVSFVSSCLITLVLQQVTFHLIACPSLTNIGVQTPTPSSLLHTIPWRYLFILLLSNVSYDPCSKLLIPGNINSCHLGCFVLSLLSKLHCKQIKTQQHVMRAAISQRILNTRVMNEALVALRKIQLNRHTPCATQIQFSALFIFKPFRKCVLIMFTFRHFTNAWSIY